MMDRADAFQKFCTQRNHARHRGIEWRFSFEQWLEWWGDDLDRRGVGHDELQMQRIADAGAYEPGNVRKGYPKDNAKTRCNVQLRERGVEKKEQWQRDLAAVPVSDARERYFDEMSEDEQELDRMFRCKVRAFYSHQ